VVGEADQFASEQLQCPSRTPKRRSGARESDERPASEAKFLVGDKEAWDTSVCALEQCIRKHANDPEDADVLFSKVKNAGFAPSTPCVTKALEPLAMMPPKEVLDEVKKGRNISAHNFVMTRGTSDSVRDLCAEKIRVERVRSLLMAVMARSVAYQGLLWGYELDQSTPLDWFHGGDEPEAARKYILERPIPAQEC
jgi:hypothetical protein